MDSVDRVSSRRLRIIRSYMREYRECRQVRLSRHNAVLFLEKYIFVLARFIFLRNVKKISIETRSKKIIVLWTANCDKVICASSMWQTDSYFSLRVLKFIVATLIIQTSYIHTGAKLQTKRLIIDNLGNI